MHTFQLRYYNCVKVRAMYSLTDITCLKLNNLTTLAEYANYVGVIQTALFFGCNI